MVCTFFGHHDAPLFVESALNAALIELQFEMGQYNALVELTSNIGKSITDTAKSLAQKV